ncbi:MAG TPA: 6-carboxytetrahydropterin synthase [Candidatus Acidoferrum sp.]|nr:6-carboxytetrahydropterin synthase [Candidatus Acidoferrum sp.]
MLIAIRHNIEVAHRLTWPKGKCENIHGHSMIVELSIDDLVNEKGLAGGIDFGKIKEGFRQYLDTYYDHRLILNAEDPWANLGIVTDSLGNQREDLKGQLPGLRVMWSNPTTENIAIEILRWCKERYGNRARTVRVDETKTNTVIADTRDLKKEEA